MLDGQSVGHGTHLQVVGEQHAWERQLAPQQFGADRAAQRCGHQRIEGRVHHVRAHQRDEFVSDFSKWPELHPPQPVEVVGDFGQVQVTVEVGVAVAREVLAAGHDP